MKVAAVIPLALIAVAGRPGVTRAQDAGKVGLTMGYPSAVGVIWRVTPHIAIRPEVTLSRATGDSSGIDAVSVPISTNDSTGVGVGISGLFYVRHWDALRAYVSPRFSYSRNTSSGTSNASVAESTASSYLTSGSFGVEYSLGRHFGLFGEVGLGYTSASADSTSTLTIGSVTVGGGVPAIPARTQLIQSSSRSRSLGTRSGAGVIFFF